MQRHPKVSIDIDLQDSVTDLVEQRIDLAIRIASAPDPSLIGKPIAVCESVLVASPDYLAGKPAVRVPSDLVGHEHRPGARLARTTPLYPVLDNENAIWGVVNGWERALCFKPADQPDFVDEHSFRFTPTKELVANEIKALTTNVGLMEVSGFNRYEIRGEGAGEFLDYLVCGKIPTVIGRVSLCYLLNEHEKFDQIADYDLVLTTYPLILRDAHHYEDQQFYYLILDEAQLIKNARSKTTVKIRELKATHRLCLSGTPIENHLGELWSMYHFLMPGYLGTEERFNRLFRKPIEREGNGDRGKQLRRRVQPFMLRRTKDLVTQELPKKTEIIRSVSLVGKQRDLYETVRLAMDKKVRDEISKKGLARSHIM